MCVLVCFVNNEPPHSRAPGPSMFLHPPRKRGARKDLESWRKGNHCSHGERALVSTGPIVGATDPVAVLKYVSLHHRAYAPPTIVGGQLKP